MRSRETSMGEVALVQAEDGSDQGGNKLLEVGMQVRESFRGRWTHLRDGFSM